MHQLVQYLVTEILLEDIDSRVYSGILQITCSPPALNTIVGRCGQRSSIPVRAQYDDIPTAKRVLESTQLSPTGVVGVARAARYLYSD